MSSTRGKLQHRQMLFFVARENFGFGDVGGSVDIDQIGRRAVRLIARQASMRMRPLRPAANVIQMQIGDRLAIVTFDARDSLRRALAEERGKLGAEVVATP